MSTDEIFDFFRQSRRRMSRLAASRSVVMGDTVKKTTKALDRYVAARQGIISPVSEIRWGRIALAVFFGLFIVGFILKHTL